MKRCLWLLALLIIVSVAVQNASHGQPGDGGATLKLPGMDPAPAKTGAPDPLKGLWNPAASAFPAPIQRGGAKVAEPPSNANDMNKDIEINAKVGHWVIFVMAYSGPKAPEMARKLVAVMRGHYKWNAYVFNYGAEEKRKEYERVQKIRQEQKDALIKAELDPNVPIRVAAIRIAEQTAVLVGGYKTRDEASAALTILKKLDPNPLKGKVDLDTVYTVKADRTKSSKAEQLSDGDIGYVNPFKMAFIARNPHPDVPKDQNGMTPEEELKFLRLVNREEPLTLLQCKKPFTLAVKQYNMQFKTADNTKEANSFLETFNQAFFLKSDKRIWQDHAAHNAHNLAEAFRKRDGLNLEAYVLHAKYCSYVTVGSYDSLQDPQLIAMQNFLDQQFKLDAYRALELFPRPMPMPVPGVGMR
jgi:hypothetical protein